MHSVQLDDNFLVKQFLSVFFQDIQFLFAIFRVFPVF